MKNLKVLLITALVAFAVVSYADKKPKNVKTITKIEIEQVFTVPGLAGAVYQATGPNFIKPERRTYHVYVMCNKKLYYVSGSNQAWKSFFKKMPVPAQRIWRD